MHIHQHLHLHLRLQSQSQLHLMHMERVEGCGQAVGKQLLLKGLVRIWGRGSGFS
jgi:hypothetical protein